jgi:hypothetical protein
MYEELSIKLPIFFLSQNYSTDIFEKKLRKHDNLSFYK